MPSGAREIMLKKPKGTKNHFTRFGLRDVDVESIVRSQDVVYENAATCWQDGHILGNGDIGAVCYAPYWLEWTINKVDVFDGRMAKIEKLTYREAMAEAARRKTVNLRFLNELVKKDPSYDGPPEPLLKSCGQIKIRTMSNEYSWAATLPCRIRQTLSLWEAKDRMILEMPSAAETMLDPDPRPEATSFVCRDVNLLVIRMKKATNQWWAKKLELCRPYDADYEPAQFGRNAAGDCIWFEQKMPDGSSYAMALGVVSTGGIFHYLDLDANDRTLWERHVARGQVLGAEQKGDRAWINVDGDMDIFVATASSRETIRSAGGGEKNCSQRHEEGIRAAGARTRHGGGRTSGRSRLSSLRIRCLNNSGMLDFIKPARRLDVRRCRDLTASGTGTATCPARGYSGPYIRSIRISRWPACRFLPSTIRNWACRSWIHS